MRRPVVIASACMAGLVLAACGGGGKSKAANSSIPELTAPAVVPSTAPAPRTIAKSVWFAGFKVTVETATLTTGIGAPTTITSELSVNATFENEGNEVAQFRGDVSVSSHGQDFPAQSSGELPRLPGGGKGKGTFSFQLDGTTSLDDAVLTFGGPDVTRATVPLGTAGDLVSLEPLAVTGLSTVAAGDVKVDIKSGEARADKVEQHGQADKGHWYVYLKGTLNFTSSSAGGTNFGPEQVSVKLPDGTSTVGEAADSQSCCYALYPDKPPAEFTFRFLVGDPPTGSYTGAVKDKTGGQERTAAFSFQVAKTAAGSSTTTSTTPGGSTGTTASTTSTTTG